MNFRSFFNLSFVPGFYRAILRILFFRKSREHFSEAGLIWKSPLPLECCGKVPNDCECLRKEIWTPAQAPAVTLPDPAVFINDPICVKAERESVIVEVMRVDNEKPLINGSSTFVVPKGTAACFMSNGKEYFVHVHFFPQLMNLKNRGIIPLTTLRRTNV